MNVTLSFSNGAIVFVATAETEPEKRMLAVLGTEAEHISVEPVFGNAYPRNERTDALRLIVRKTRTEDIAP